LVSQSQNSIASKKIDCRLQIKYFKSNYFSTNVDIYLDTRLAALRVAGSRYLNISSSKSGFNISDIAISDIASINNYNKKH